MAKAIDLYTVHNRDLSQHCEAYGASWRYLNLGVGDCSHSHHVLLDHTTSTRRYLTLPKDTVGTKASLRKDSSRCGRCNAFHSSMKTKMDMTGSSTMSEWNVIIQPRFSFLGHRLVNR